MEKRTKVSRTTHQFLDEAGDTAFYGKGMLPIVGTSGVSECFILCLVNFRDPLQDVRQKIIALQKQVESDTYYNGVPSIEKKKKVRDSIFTQARTLGKLKRLFLILSNGLIVAVKQWWVERYYRCTSESIITIKESFMPIC